MHSDGKHMMGLRNETLMKRVMGSFDECDATILSLIKETRSALDAINVVTE